MPSQKQWRVRRQQQALLEYSSVKRRCPPGVYLAANPAEEFSQWTGVYFVRKGSYAPAVLRFCISFPDRYPELPPQIVFSNDIFHPLVSPLTTYTYSTASPARNPVSSGDEKLLAPGTLNLSQGFPIWFDEHPESVAEVEDASSPARSQGIGPDDLGFSEDEFAHDSPPNRPRSSDGRKMFFMPPPAPDALEWSLDKTYPGIVEVLYYMTRAFEDDDFLDTVPRDSAANSNALHAWTAYRKRIKEAQASKGTQGPSTSSPRFPPRNQSLPPGARSPANWNWGGVWQDRVKKSIRESISEQKLYKDGHRDEMIMFLDREKEEVMQMKADMLAAAAALVS